jgi:1-acyl-sn-glycerol-3-phosphate acyltransferase
MIKEAVKRLCAGEAIAMFPGGERARESDGAENFKRGIDVLARLSRAAILPVYIDGADRSLPAGGRFPRPAKMRVCIGPPLLHGRDYGEDGAARAVLEAIRKLRG